MVLESALETIPKSDAAAYGRYYLRAIIWGRRAAYDATDMEALKAEIQAEAARFDSEPLPGAEATKVREAYQAFARFVESYQ